MHETFCSHVKTTDALSRSRFGTTCGRLMDDRGEALLMWFREASRVRISAQPVEAQESKARNQDSGQKWRESFAKYDPTTRSLKTVQSSLLEDSTAYCATLPRWGSMQSGELSERTIPAHLTNVIVSGSLLPTPSASSYGTNQGGGMGRTGKVRPSLQTMARKNLWPTPNSRDWKDSETQGNRKSINLGTAVHQTSPWRSCKGCENFWCVKHQMHAHDCECPPIEKWDTSPYSIGGKLNPTWVEWLMGWPLGWTDLSASATDKFQAWLHSHGAR